MTNLLDSKSKKPVTIQSVDRALNLVEFIAENNGECGLSEIARGIGLNKATVYGLLSTLEQHRYIELDPDTKKYSLGVYIAELAMKTQDYMDVRKIAKSYMEKLAVTYTANVQLGIESDGEVLYVEVSKYNSVLPIVCQVNSRLPFYCTGVGKAIMAFWPEEHLNEYLSKHNLKPQTPKTITTHADIKKELDGIREHGYAIEDEENQIGVISISAPIFSLDGTVIAGISISLIKAIYTRELKNLLVNDILQCSREISAKMGYSSEYKTK